MIVHSAKVLLLMFVIFSLTIGILPWAHMLAIFFKIRPCMIIYFSCFVMLFPICSRVVALSLPMGLNCC